MGNCQAVDAAALVIQHPSGRIERMYWSVSASEVMKMNPGHYVIPLPPAPKDERDTKTVGFTRAKLLRPTDTLVLGRAYRLVTTHEVIKVLRAKRHAKMNNYSPESMEPSPSASGGDHEPQPVEVVDNTNHVDGNERMSRQGSASSSIFASSTSKSWRPSLQSISEATS